MIDLLIFLLKPALRAAENNSHNPLDYLALLIAFPLDILIAHTTWAAIAGFPKKGEWTISQTLERLCRDGSNPDIILHMAIARKINWAAGCGHIKSVV